MVRGASDEAAWSRLMAGYDSGDPDLKAAFAELSEGRLSVYAGEPCHPLDGSCCLSAQPAGLHSFERACFDAMHMMFARLSGIRRSCLYPALPSTCQRCTWHPCAAAESC